MAETIAYDKPIVDMIAQMDAIGNVNHVSYQKKSVTFHHNAARLSIPGILEVWRTRPASAHFQVDAYASVGQFVRVNEYAWAQGHTLGNQESISIEMANSTLSPTWEVLEVTWREAARLAGWLHAKVIGVRPTRATMRKHKDWKATECSGPYIDTVFDTQIIPIAQAAYDAFMAPPVVVTPPPVVEPPPPVVVPPPPPPDPTYEAPLPVIKPDPALPSKWVAPALPPRRITPVAGLPVDAVAANILAGRWGGRDKLETRLKTLGYDPEEVRGEMFNTLRNTGTFRMVRRTFRR